MKCNHRELAPASEGKCDIEGRLNYRKINAANYGNPPVFKERWFKLINNFLFYFKLNDIGKVGTRQAEGVFVLESSRISAEPEQEIPFAFSISFTDEPEKKHVFSARSQENVEQWVTKLKRATYEYMRNKLYTLQAKIFEYTGKDPLLMVPRNEGSMKWSPSLPPQTKEKCTSITHKSSFHCHLSKQFNDSVSSMRNNTTTNHSSVDHHITGNSMFFNRHNPFDNALTDNDGKHDAAYHRVAPSPPLRKKYSPNPPRNDKQSAYHQGVSENAGYNHSVTAPVKPLRKHQVGPPLTNDKCPHGGNDSLDLLDEGVPQIDEPPVGDLIQF